MIIQILQIVQIIHILYKPTNSNEHDSDFLTAAVVVVSVLDRVVKIHQVFTALYDVLQLVREQFGVQQRVKMAIKKSVEFVGFPKRGSRD